MNKILFWTIFLLPLQSNKMRMQTNNNYVIDIAGRVAVAKVRQKIFTHPAECGSNRLSRRHQKSCGAHVYSQSVRGRNSAADFKLIYSRDTLVFYQHIRTSSLPRCYDDRIINAILSLINTRVAHFQFCILATRRRNYIK